MMEKAKAIRIITKAAALYHTHLENQSVLFLYGIPNEINRQVREKNIKFLSLKGYEAVFCRCHFLHLTGVKIHRIDSTIVSANHFFEKCLSHRLRQEDFSFSRDGSTDQKLDILEEIMNIKKNAIMLGDFIDYGPKLFTEKVAGNVCGCIGFVKDRRTKHNVPNTLLKKDIRDVIAAPVQKVYAVFSKSYAEPYYSTLEKIDKTIRIEQYAFAEEIEALLDRNLLRYPR